MECFSENAVVSQGNNSTNENRRNPFLRQYSIHDDIPVLRRMTRSVSKIFHSEDFGNADADLPKSYQIAITGLAKDGKGSWLRYFRNRSSGATTRQKTIDKNETPRRILQVHFNKPPVLLHRGKQAKIVRHHLGLNRSLSMPGNSGESEQFTFRTRRTMSVKESPENRKHELLILEQTKDFCRDIIIQTLKRNNMFNRVKISRAPTADKGLSHEISTICSELERRNPALCKNLSRQIGITLRSEEVLRKIFFELASEIILSDKEDPTDSEKRSTMKRRRSSVDNNRNHVEQNQTREKELHITWGRVLGIFVASGAFAIDCIKQGHSELVSELIEYSGEFFVEEGVVDWISSRGGWRNLCEINSIKASEVDPANVWNIILMSACIFAVLAFGVGINNLTAAGL